MVVVVVVPGVKSGKLIQVKTSFPSREARIHSIEEMITFEDQSHKVWILDRAAGVLEKKKRVNSIKAWRSDDRRQSREVTLAS